jgi:DNA-binding LytR/AlgR family response regulator
MTWRAVGQDAYRELDGYAGLVPFSLLCALAVLGTERWAARVDRRLRQQQELRQAIPSETASSFRPEKSAQDHTAVEPALRSRLSSSFEGPIIALQSEDHYVRAHGSRGSELLLMRLRDAIQEMGSVPGQQVHRSWWVANEGVARFEQAGRSWIIQLKNGENAPIARDSLFRLQQSGFLPKQAS